MTDQLPLYLVELGFDGLPLSLGAIETYARHVHGAAFDEQFRIERFRRPTRQNVLDAAPGIWLFPNYIWSVDGNFALAQTIRATGQRHILVHGGPSTPTRAQATETVLRSQPGVDIMCRGEGEATIAELLPRLGDALRTRRDWRTVGLENVAGISYLQPDDGPMVRTADRARIKTLDASPSPYLSGSMDPWMELGGYHWAMLETNRGCPYGCTFCDWGMATQQKIHRFDMERIKAEAEWIARNKFDSLFITDANFGIFDRDVEIAEHLGDLRRKYGYPLEVNVCYAKNGNPRIPKIVKALAGAGMMTRGIISIQTIDPDVLATIKRSNIKTKNYEGLIADFRRNGLPVATELMIGLPGSTLASHRVDLQWAIDADLAIRYWNTIALPNSPMTDPDYIAEHGLVIRDGVLVGSDTADEADIQVATGLARIYDIMERATLLRYVMRYLQWEYGILASDFLFSLVEALHAHPERFPDYLPAPFSEYRSDGDPEEMSMGAVVEAVARDPDPFYTAIWRHCTETLGVPLGSGADRAVFELNSELIPHKDRLYPIEHTVAWDIVGYFADCAAPKDGTSRTLEPVQPPQKFLISDPEGLAGFDLGQIMMHNSPHRAFELEWPSVDRAALHQVSEAERGGEGGEQHTPGESPKEREPGRSARD